MAAVAALLVVVLAVRQITRASTTEVWTAKNALKAGQKIDASQLVRSRVPKNAVPANVIRDPAAVLGRVLQAPVAQGAPLTMQEFAAQGEQVWLSDAPAPGRVVMTIPIAGNIVPVSQFRRNDRLDLLVGNGTESVFIARDAHFIGSLQSKAQPQRGGGGLIPGLIGERRSGGGTVAVVLAVREQDVNAIATAQGRKRISFALHGRNEPPYVPAPAMPAVAGASVDLIMGAQRSKVEVNR